MSRRPGTGRLRSSGWRRLRTLLRPKATRAHLVVALLCGLLGFALVTQVRTSSSAAGTRTARAEDLVRILDDLSARSDRLRQEIDALRATRDRLASGQQGGAAALAEIQGRATALGILAGTVPASGPGITITVRDPQGKVRADALLGAVEELRDAGAQALQIDGQTAGQIGGQTGGQTGGPGGGSSSASPARAVRIVASTAFLDAPGGGVLVDGKQLNPPYRLLAVGDPQTLSAALRIPGGVVDTIAAQPGASATIAANTPTVVNALHPLTTPRYARPTGPAP